MTPRADEANVPSRQAYEEQVASDLKALLKAFTDAGETAYLSGQALRDLLTNGHCNESRRAEIFTSATQTRIAQIVTDADLPGTEHKSTIHRGQKYLSFTADGPKAGRTILVTTLRKKLPGNRWFGQQSFAGIHLDLATREITIHALALSADYELIDPFDGLDDLKAGLIRTIIPHRRVFAESPRWLLKVAKYIGYYGYSAAPEILRSAPRNAGNILDTPAEYWIDEIEKILLSSNVMVALEFLHRTTVLQFILPEVEAMIGFHKSCPVHHKDLWQHTKEVIHKASRNPVVRFAALMHDIGKLSTRSVTNDGKVHFFRHEEMGAQLFCGVAHRLRMQPELAARVEYTIRHHSRVNLYEESWTDSAVRRLIRDCEEHLDDLIAFSKADFTTKRASRANEIIRQILDLERRIAEITELDQRVPSLPTGLGNEIMTELHIAPGPIIGKIKKWLEAEIEAERLAPQQESAVYVAYLQNHREEAGIPLPT